MQQVFLINPTAGRADASRVLPEQIRTAAQALSVPVEITVTQYAGHARAITEQLARQNEPVRVIACGGDGTLNEVVQAAAGHPQVQVGCMPCGSGNDYVRNFGAAEEFLDPTAQLTACPVSLDALATSFGPGVDICAAGLDAQVAYGIPKFRRLPGCGGSMAYTLSIVQTLFSHFGHSIRVTLDGKTHTDTYMMAALCNGRQYGGGYCAAPLAVMDDGLMDALLIKPISRLKVAEFLMRYKKGAHLHSNGVVDARFAPYLTYTRARRVELEVLDERPLIATVDGECAPVRTLFAEIIPNGLTVLLPKTVLERRPPVLGQQLAVCV